MKQQHIFASQTLATLWVAFFFILCSTDSYAQLAAGLKAGFIASVLSTGTSDEGVGGYGFQIAKNISYGDKDQNLIRAGAELSFSYFKHIFSFRNNTFY